MKQSTLYRAISIAAVFSLVSIGSPHAKETQAELTPSANPQLVPIDCIEPMQKSPVSSTDTELIPIDDCDPGGGGGGGPYQAPSTPSSITYAPYTNSNVLRVSWSASNGYGYSVQYELYESKNGGTWTQVYSGYGTSANLSNRGQGKYRYRVRAKNTAYTGSYRTGSGYALVNPRPANNLYAKYPSAMSAMDQKNAQYFQVNNQVKKSSLARAKMAGQGTVSGRTTSSDGRFYLGDGYDLVRGTLKETCLDVNHVDFTITKTPPLQPSTFSIDYVNDNRHLAELLEVSQSAEVGFSSDDFTLGLSGEKERYLKSATDETIVRFVVKVKNRREFWKLNTPANAIYPELVNQVLSPNDDQAKADFRERCGDNYINSANLGSALYLVFMFDSKKYSYEERESAKAELGLKIGDFFSASGAAGSSSSLTETLDRLEVKINADQVGGPAGLAASITPTNVMTKYNQFVQDTSSSNWAAVDYSTNNYQRPTIYNAYTHQQIFADYRGNQGPLAQMKRWLDISVQHKERCDPWAVFGQTTPTACRTGEAEISIAMDLCRETLEWANCMHPNQYYTGDFNATYTGTYLLGWLSSNLKKLEGFTVTQRYDHHVHRGSISVDDSTCLSSSACFTNKYRGSGPGIGKGFFIKTYYYDNPKGGSRSYNVSPMHCARTQVYLKTGNPPFGDTTADWDYTVDVEGMCPMTENFVVVP